MSAADRELLELAAKAAGYTPAVVTDDGVVLLRGVRVKWNPLTDDGDALRLALLLGIQVWRDDDILWIGHQQHAFVDPNATARRAIVSAAAEIGKAMP